LTVCLKFASLRNKDPARFKKLANEMLNGKLVPHGGRNRSREGEGSPEARRYQVGSLAATRLSLRRKTA
jgi:hypothetical protein